MVSPRIEVRTSHCPFSISSLGENRRKRDTREHTPRQTHTPLPQHTQSSPLENGGPMWILAIQQTVQNVLKLNKTHSSGDNDKCEIQKEYFSTQCKKHKEYQTMFHLAGTFAVSRCGGKK
jgi:hypothetical protein